MDWQQKVTAGLFVTLLLGSIPVVIVAAYFVMILWNSGVVRAVSGLRPVNYDVTLAFTFAAMFLVMIGRFWWVAIKAITGE